MDRDILEVLFSEEEIAGKVGELGAAISKRYVRRDLVMVSILRGGVVFLADLIRTLSIPVTIDFMAVSGYGMLTETAGVVRVIKDLEESIYRRHVLVVEDIIDTGLTLNYLLRNLASRGPASLNVVTLLDKSVRRIADIPMAFKGFDVPDVFVVGYGLDYRQKYRNLPFIGVLKERIYVDASPEA